MKGSIKIFVSGVLVTLVFISLIGTAFATKGKLTVDLDYNDIRVTLDGQEVPLVDANGNPVEPFTINGTTYLPVRAVANALGLDVGWDQESFTVVLNTKDTRPQRDGFNDATNQSVKVGSYTFSIPNYLIQTGEYDYEYEDNESAAVLLLDSVKPDGWEEISLSTVLAHKDELLAVFSSGLDSAISSEEKIIQTESGIEGMRWNLSFKADRDGLIISGTVIGFLFPDIENDAFSVGTFIISDMAKYAYDDDVAKIISSVRKENSPSSTSNKGTNTSDSSSGSSKNDGDMPDGSQMVYVTSTGKRYHYDSTCNGGKYTLTTLEKAKSQGLTPCQKCVLH